MQKISVIAIFDVGKTNKKLFLFDQHYQIVYEKTARFIETSDEDGFACDNIDSLRLSVFESLNEVLRLDRFDIKAINFTTYGASLVYVDSDGKPLAPLFNYLKPYPEDLNKRFYKAYGGEEAVCLQTASPCSGSLNSGLQLYRIKNEKPELFARMKYALHLPQFMSSLITGKFYSDITSIGCHTHLWDFQKNDYHRWIYEEKLDQKLAPIFPSNQVIQTQFMGKEYLAGVGLHDSSAALIPYLVNFTEPFILISTGTWCISLNPFNDSPLTKEEINCNCLCYLSYQGKPVKASRLFAGYEHEQQTKRIAAHFQMPASLFRTMNFSPEIIEMLKKKNVLDAEPIPPCAADFTSKFTERNLEDYGNIKEAYHQLIMDILEQQFLSTNMIMQKGITKKIFVDGGFSKNNIYMNLLAAAFPNVEVYAASMAQATALGTAIAIHSHWNKHPLPNDIIDLKFFANSQNADL